MPKRVGGFINQDGLNAPDQATGVSAASGDEQATVSFTAPADVGGSAITAFRAQSNDGIGASASGSPITVPGLTNDTAYTFRVWALNAFGLSSPSDASGSVTPVAPIGVFGGGEIDGGGTTNTITFVSINSTGNSTDFGDLTVARAELAGCSSAVRGVFAGGSEPPTTKYATIDFLTIASSGNATSFGSLTQGRGTISACSSAVRGVFAGGESGGIPSATNVIDFITFASAGSATDFGDLAVATIEMAGCSSPTRGLFGCGKQSAISASSTNVIYFITIASTGNATDFGDATQARLKPAACSTDVRGVFAGGYTAGGSELNVATIDFATIASAGNASSFGDLSVARAGVAGCSSVSRGVFGGGATGGGGIRVNTIDFVTIASAGNATDFGDLTAVTRDPGACSNAHGGLS